MARSDLGETIWKVSWREHDELVMRIVFSIPIGAIGAFGFGKFVLGLGEHVRLGAREGYPMLAVGLVFAALAFVFFGPDRHAHLLGTAGLVVERHHHGYFTSRRLLPFAEVDDVEVKYTRIVTDAVSQLYTGTQVDVRFLARDGKPLLALTGTLEEPLQRSEGWAPEAPVDLTLRDRIPKTSQARLGLDGRDAFRAFADQRERAPYR